MLKANSLSKAYLGDSLFDDIQLVLNPGNKAGLVGPNGVGKSTLLRILAGVEKPDSGNVVIGGGDVIGFLPQQAIEPSLTIAEFMQRSVGKSFELGQSMKSLEALMASGVEDIDQVMVEYGKVQEEYDKLGGWTTDANIELTRENLNITHLPDSATFMELSGGEQARVLMTGVLLKQPTILLLDEPTNHLDIDGLKWLEEYLESFLGIVIVISHDRRFLDNVVSEIYELDGINDELQSYQGGYSDYVLERQRRYEKLLQDYEAQEKFRKRLEADIAKTKQQAIGVEQSTKNDVLRRYAKKVAKKAKSRERRLARQMQQARWIVRPETRPKIVLDSAATSVKGKLLVRLKKVRFSYDKTMTLQIDDMSIKGRDRIVITGPNGCGKSTLLKLINGNIKPDQGEIDNQSSIGYLPQDHYDLPGDKKLLEYFRSYVPMYEDEARKFLDRLLFEQYQMNQELKSLSPGESSRLLLGIMVASGSELLLLDEPTNHLDFDSLDVVEEMLLAFRGTLMIVSHDRFFIDRINVSRHLTFNDGKLEG